MAAAEKQVESMGYSLVQERGRWPFPNPILGNMTEKTRESAHPLVKQIWEFLEEQLEIAEKREMTVGRFVTSANEVFIGGFWSEHPKGELRSTKTYEILRFMRPFWEKKYTDKVFYAGKAIFEAFVQDI